MSALHPGGLGRLHCTPRGLGVAIETVASRYGLGFLPLQAEGYDLVIPVSRLDRAAVRRFVTILHDGAVRAELARMGFRGPE
jgi:putative molybdopterin biosynthesis protein